MEKKTKEIYQPSYEPEQRLGTQQRCNSNTTNVRPIKKIPLHNLRKIWGGGGTNIKGNINFTSSRFSKS